MKVEPLDDEPNTGVLEHLDELRHRRGWRIGTDAYATLVLCEQLRKQHEILHRIACALEAMQRSLHEEIP